MGQGKISKRDTVLRVGAILSAVLFLLYTIQDPQLSTDPTTQTILKSLISRVIGSLVFLFVLLYLRYRLFFKPDFASLSAILPSLAVVINNYPILSAVRGDLYLTRADLVPLFALDALFIGIFEELAFRGVLFPILLEKRHNSSRQIFNTTLVTSALFGLIHLVNLIEGAGIGATLRQVGYSFLIGGMCAIVLLKSGNLIFCILLHAIFDFCGGIYDQLGEGTYWNVPTIIVTAVLGVAVFAWMLYLLFRIKPEQVDKFFSKNIGDTENEHG